MKRFLTLALVGVLALGLTSTAYATYCANDVVPASTLLFPFVQYDYTAGDAGITAGGNQGATTLFAITNVSNKAQIVHITLWTDYSIAILDFNIVLTGYDVQTMNIRDILRDGILPFEEGAEVLSDATGVTFYGDANIWELGNAGDTPADLGPFSSNNQLHGSAVSAWFAASPTGNGLPAPEGTATSDGAVPPAPTSPLDCDPTWDASPNNYAGVLPIDGGTLANFRTFLEASMMADTYYANCVSPIAPVLVYPIDIDLTDPDDVDTIPASAYDPALDTPWWLDDLVHPAWMYITADVVGACNKDLPDGDAALYFGLSGAGIAYDNVLMGDVFWLNPGAVEGEVNFSEADNAVHLEAFLGNGGVTDDNGDPTTFYSRYHAAVTGPSLADGREPLGTAWAFRYFHAPNVADVASTSIRTWKGSTNQGLAQDLNNGNYAVGPDLLYANSCTPYTYYAWDEDENVVGVSGGFIPPWSGEDPQPLPQPNLFPLETQEIDARQFYLVGDTNLAFGWMMFIWPRSNTNDPAGLAGFPSDQYQTWMGVKYQAFGTSSAAFGALQIANWNCDGGAAAMPFPLLNRISYSE